MSTDKRHLNEINRLRVEIEELHVLREQAEELQQLREQAEELHLLLERRRAEYRAQRQRVMDSYDELGIGLGPTLRISDPTEGDPPAMTSASELRARLQRHYAVQHDR